MAWRFHFPIRNYDFKYRGITIPELLLQIPENEYLQAMVQKVMDETQEWDVGYVVGNCRVNLNDEEKDEIIRRSGLGERNVKQKVGW